MSRGWFGEQYEGGHCQPFCPLVRDCPSCAFRGGDSSAAQQDSARETGPRRGHDTPTSARLGDAKWPPDRVNESEGLAQPKRLSLTEGRAPMVPYPIDEMERFWAKVQTGPGCWVWTASTRGSAGYGRFTRKGSRGAVLAHRYSYEMTHGAIPESLVIDHLCCNPSCVRPSHLEAVTQLENMRRSADIRAGRRVKIGSVR